MHRALCFCRELMYEKKPSSWWPSWKMKSGYGRRGSTPSKPKRRWLRPPVVRREAFVLPHTSLSSRLYCCTFIFTPASSAPSAPSLGGSLSAGSHSGGGDPDQAWPQSSGEEDLQLQLALAMSKEEAEQVVPSSRHGSVTSQLSNLRSGRERFATCWPAWHNIPRRTPAVAFSLCNAWPSPRKARTLWRMQRSAMLWHSAKRYNKRSEGRVCAWTTFQPVLSLSVCPLAALQHRSIRQPITSACPVALHTLVADCKNDFSRSILIFSCIDIGNFSPNISKIFTPPVMDHHNPFPNLTWNLSVIQKS